MELPADPEPAEGNRSEERRVVRTNSKIASGSAYIIVCSMHSPRRFTWEPVYIMHGIRPKVGRWGGAEIGWVGRLLEFAENQVLKTAKNTWHLTSQKKRCL